MRDILEECGVGDHEDVVLQPAVEGQEKIKLYRVVMEEDYDEGWQVAGAEGDLVFFDMVTYGYGEFIAWGDIEAKKKILEEWCAGVCERHNCKYEIRVSANYW
jgi:hypothetical protein